MSAQFSASQRWFVFTLVMLAMMPVIIDMTILHIAVPSLTQSLQASTTEVLWIIDIYPLLMAGLLVPMGTLIDKYGVRRMMLLGLTLFTIASALAAFSPSAWALIGARVLLACGGSMIIPGVLATIRKTFSDPNERAMALGLWGAASAAGAAFGPLMGGVLLAYFWWGSVFLINVPIMLIVGPICWRYLPKDQGTGGGKWPISQALIMIIGMISVVYALKAGIAGKAALGTVGGIALFGVGLLAVFIHKQLTDPEPMLDLSLFSHPAIMAGLIIAVLVSGALAGLQLTLAQELQYVLDFTPLEAGAFMIPLMVCAGLGGPFAGWFNNLFGLRVVASVSLFFSGLMLGWLALIDLGGSGILGAVILGLLGLALAIGLTASSIAIMGSVRPEQGGAAGALEATGYELGAGLGITFFGVMLSSIFTQTIELPSSLALDLAQTARLSIADAFIVAKDLAPEQAALVIQAAKDAFSATHSIVLGAAAILVGALAVAVVFLLAGYQPNENADH